MNEENLLEAARIG